MDGTTTLPNAEMTDAIVASIIVSPIASIVTDNKRVDNLILVANDAFRQLTGYSSREVIGRNGRFLAGAASEPEARAALKSAVADGRPAVVE